MGYLEIFLVGIGLAMDAFAVSICKGIQMPKLKKMHVAIIALFFGGFQMLMPLMGWLLGTQFAKYISSFSHWVSFVLLAFLGIKMIIEAFKDDDCDTCGEEKLDFKDLFVMAIATSIDALAAGLTFAMYPDVNIVNSIGIIGIVTFVICAIGVCLGHLFIIVGQKLGEKFKIAAEVIGGCVLLGIGIKLLIEGLIK